MRQSHNHSPSNSYHPTPHFAEQVSIGTRSLYATLRGSGPVVILELGAAGGGTWGNVVEELAKVATVVLYDRAGVGASEVADDERTVECLARDLHALVDALPIDGPVLLVGWSLTGLSALWHGFEFPEDLSGLVLIDPTPHTLYADQGSAPFAPNFRRQLRQQRLMSAIGFGRLWGRNSTREFLRRNAGDIKDASVLQAYADSLQNLVLSPASDELYSLADSCDIVARKWSEPFAEVPLIVLSATVNSANHPRTTQTMISAQKAMADLSRLGEFRPVSGGSHMMTLDRPDAIVGAVRDILEK